MRQSRKFPATDRAKVRAERTTGVPALRTGHQLARGMLELQGQVGNRAVSRFFGAAQASLRVGPASDRYEREADEVAARVLEDMRGGTGGQVARQWTQRSPGAASLGGAVGHEGGPLDADTEQVIRSPHSTGKPLNPALSQRFGAAMGADFGSVRLHAGPEATALNDQMGATAFTVGKDIFFRQGLPGTGAAGMRLMAHELTHTIQQGATTPATEKRQE